MTSYQDLMKKVLKHVELLKFDKTHKWHQTLVSLYCSIVEYSDTLIKLNEEKKSIAMPLLARSMLEAYIDLVNLADDKSYGYNMDASYLHEWLRLVKATSENNPFLEGVSDVDGYPEQIARWETELAKLKKNGFGKLNNFERFEKAGNINEYRSIYNILCSYSHNNIRALIDRHYEINGDQSGFELTVFKEYNEDDNIHIMQTGEGCLQTGSFIIHNVLNTGYQNVFRI